jgi:hypothetical protein
VERERLKRAYNLSPEGEKRRAEHWFKPGNSGRPVGSKVFWTKTLREDILAAVAELGSDGRGRGGLRGWLKLMAKRHPVEYLKVVARVLPFEVHRVVEEEEPVYRSIPEIQQELARRGIPTKSIYGIGDLPHAPPTPVTPQPNGSNGSASPN